MIIKTTANKFLSTMAEGAENYQAEHLDRFGLVVNGIKDERDITWQVSLVKEVIELEVCLNRNKGWLV